MIGYIAGSGWPSRSDLISEKRIHLYDHHNEVTLPIQRLRDAGCEAVILTAAAGSLFEEIPVGSILQVADTITAYMPPVLRGPKFVDCSSLFQTFDDLPVCNHVFMPGPHYETPLDKKLLAMTGAHVVGMSITPEAIEANRLGMKVYALVVVTNGPSGKHDHQEVLKNAQEANLDKYLDDYIKRVHSALR